VLSADASVALTSALAVVAAAVLSADAPAVLVPHPAIIKASKATAATNTITRFFIDLHSFNLILFNIA
jgi:hypothetical protein